jgi:hypothetical protein
MQLFRAIQILRENGRDLVKKEDLLSIWESAILEVQTARAGGPDNFFRSCDRL